MPEPTQEPQFSSTILLRWPVGPPRFIKCNRGQRLTALKMYRKWRSWETPKRARSEALYEAEQWRS